MIVVSRREPVVEDGADPVLIPSWGDDVGLCRRPDRIVNVLIIGDSEACAVGRIAQEAIVAVDLGMHATVNCRTGSHIQDWSPQVIDSIIRGDHDAIMVFLGTNHHDQVELPDVQPLLDVIERRGIACVWAGSVPIGGHGWYVNELLRDAIVPTCGYVDLESIVVELPDGLHPTPTGAREWLNVAMDTVCWRTRT